MISEKMVAEEAGHKISKLTAADSFWTVIHRENIQGRVRCSKLMKQ